MHVTIAASNIPLLNTPPAARRRVAEIQLRRLQQQFARPVHINSAYAVLESRNILLLDGAPGSGRSTAARVLLRELPRSTGTYHELATESHSGKGPHLSPEDIGAQDRMLLDLSAADESFWSAVQAQLWDFCHAVHKNQAYLAVVLPTLRQDRLAPEFFAFRKKIERPDGMDVIVRHLRCGGLDTKICDPPPSVLLSFVQKEPPMRELALLADRILQVRAVRHERGAFVAWCEQAVAAQTDRGTEVATLVPQMRRGPQRALLLSSSLLHRARSEAVQQATADLLAVVKTPAETRPLLEQPGLDERLEKIDAAVDENFRVTFDRLGLAAAVRRHFWATRPDLRPSLRIWVAQSLTLSSLTDADRSNLVRRFTDLCLSTQDTAELVALVRHWTQDSSRNEQLRAAALLLERSVPSETCGGKLREQIYDWSTRPLSDSLRHVLTEICEKVMSVRHPEAALIRLHHMARREPSPGIAREALLRYATSDPGDLRLHRRLLYRLTAAPSGKHPSQDADLFLDLTTPTRLPKPFLRSSNTRTWLTTGWSSAFDRAEPERWETCATEWICAADATKDETIRGRLVDVLVSAACPRYSTLNRLYTVSRKHARPDLSALILRKISAAQTTRLSQEPTTPRQQEAARS
ncbi:hypothetical protein [Streptomyces sp. WG-D5]